jgi:putative ATP-binding cassette transporter
MDWNHELLDSLIWLGKAFGISLFGMAASIALLGTFTVWGRQFRRLTWAFFSPKRSWLPLAGLALIILMTLFSVRMNVLFSFWYNGFYTAMQKLDAKAFWFMLLVFAVLATVHVARTLFNFYLRQAFQIHWRVWLTDNLIAASMCPMRPTTPTSVSSRTSTASSAVRSTCRWGYSTQWCRCLPSPLFCGACPARWRYSE